MTVKIVSFDQEHGVVGIKWRNDMQPVLVELPLDMNGDYIVGDDLVMYLGGFVPPQKKNPRSEYVGAARNADVILSMVESDEIEEPSIDVADAITFFEQDEMDRLVKASLIRLGIISD